MTRAALAVVLIAVASTPTSAYQVDAPDEGIRREYQAARAKADRSADAQVQLALWCERHGMTAERLEHLSLAVLANPQHALARGLLGYARSSEGWIKADQRTEDEADATLAERRAEYNQRRERTERTADAHWDLAIWCEQNGLKPEAEAHFTTVVRLDPTRNAAWRKLGCKLYRGRWLRVEEIERLEADRKAQEKADRHWSTRLGRIAQDMGDARKAAGVDAALAEITDPRAVPSIWKMFVPRGEAGQRLAVRVLGQIDSQGASQALGLLAAHGSTSEVRRAAAESLRIRDAREYLHLLIRAVRKPLQYELRPNPAKNSAELFVEGMAYDLRKSYRYPSIPGVADRRFNPYAIDPTQLRRGDDLAYQAMINRALGTTYGPVDPALVQALNQASASNDPLGTLRNAVNNAQATNLGPLGMPGPLAAAANSGPAIGASNFRAEQELQRRERLAMENQQRFQAAVNATDARIQQDIREIEATNAAYNEQNQRVLPVLHALTNQDHGADPNAWARWWTEEQGYSYNPQPKSTLRDVAQAIEPTYAPISGGCSCFAAGTPVHTRDGLKAIETIQIGEQVLTFDVQSGALVYEPVIAVWHNRPDQTYRVSAGDETILSTGIHRFWKAGQGWVMARDLKPGDLIRARTGLSEVQSVATDSIRPVYNLEVARTRSFLVGKLGLLVHDYSLIETVDRPFDALAVSE